MSHLHNAASRPSRLSAVTHTLTLLLLSASFLSGLVLWRGQTIQLTEMTTPPWLGGALIVHGSLNPFLCGLFGYLACRHIRLGWQIRANRGSGLILEINFLGLILSGTGSAYTSGEELREVLTLSHRILGLILPVSLGFHLFMARHWVKNISN